MKAVLFRNRLLLADEFPVEIGEMMSLQKDVLDHPDAKFFICTCCGKIHFTCPLRSEPVEVIEKSLQKLEVS